MRIKEILKKPPMEVTNEELLYIGKYFSKHPEKLRPKPKSVLHKCYKCKHLIWWDALGTIIWKCLKKDNEMSTRMITHKRKCADFEED